MIGMDCLLSSNFNDTLGTQQKLLIKAWLLIFRRLWNCVLFFASSIHGTTFKLLALYYRYTSGFNEMKINSHMDWIHRLFEGAPQNSPKFSSSIHDSRCMILSLSGVPELCQSKACSRHTHFGKKVLCITIIQLSNSFLAGTIWKKCAISNERPFWIDTISHNYAYNSMVWHLFCTL